MTELSNLMAELRNESSAKESLVAITNRIPPEVEREMLKVCEKYNLKFSVLLRKSTIQGWELLREYFL